jgi:hypothetical protein
MKDMSVEELLDDLSSYSDVSDEHYAIKAEIIRRFEELEKECELLSSMVINLKCCGNCTNYRYGNLCDGKFISCDSWCDSWTTDGLTRAERGGDDTGR